MESRSTVPKWSLITVTYNSAAALRAFGVESRRDGEAWEHIYVDNGSSDETVELLRATGSKVVALPENRGFAAANNIGFTHARGDLIGFINPDVELIHSELEKIGDRISSSPGLYAPQLLNVDGTRQPNGRGAPYLTAKLRNRLLPSSPMPGYLLTSEPGMDRDVYWLTGAVIMTDRDTWDRVNGWDESYFLYHEDVQLSVTAREMGIKRTLMGDLEWKHGWAREATGTNWRAWRRELASAWTFYRRNRRFLALKFRRVPQL